jgi:hypothetical protein
MNAAAIAVSLTFRVANQTVESNGRCVKLPNWPRSALRA